jgi:hypothetical protein
MPTASDDFECRLCLTYLPDLPAVDFATLVVERLTDPGQDETRSGAALDDHLRRQVLDFLNASYPFPIARPLIERELAAIRQTAESELADDSLSPQERRSWDEELRQIAERRVRLGAVVNEMARRYGLGVTEDDLNREGPAATSTDATRARLTEQKVIDSFLSRAQVNERPATAEELCSLESF